MTIPERAYDIYKYITYNYKFLLIIGILNFILVYLLENTGQTLYDLIFVAIIQIPILGYGLEITKDTIHGGQHLPSIRPKQIITGGIKSIIYILIYSIPYTLIIILITKFSDFNISMELKEVILNINTFINEILNHDIIHGILFIIINFFILFIFTFFYEIGLASLADTNSIKHAINFKETKTKINNIGLRRYILDYIDLVLFIVIMTIINNYILNIQYIGPFISAFVFSLLIYITQYRAIGLIYRKTR